jgi:hypothetical protein
MKKRHFYLNIDLLVRRRRRRTSQPGHPRIFTSSLPGRISATRCPIFKISKRKQVNFLPATTLLFFTTSSERPLMSKFADVGVDFSSHPS